MVAVFCMAIYSLGSYAQKPGSEAAIKADARIVSSGSMFFSMKEEVTPQRVRVSGATGVWAVATVAQPASRKSGKYFMGKINKILSKESSPGPFASLHWRYTEFVRASPRFLL